MGGEWGLALAEEKPDAKAIHESIKLGNTKARHLSYATPDIYFRGLTKIVGRAGTDAGNDEELMRLMKREHVRLLPPPHTKIARAQRARSLCFMAPRALPRNLTQLCPMRTNRANLPCLLASAMERMPRQTLKLPISS